MALHGCGEGCFYAVVHWKQGANLLTVRAAAEGWRGGRETLRVMWPVHPDPALLARAVKAMRAVPEFTLHEQVAGDTAATAAPATRLRLSGPDFVAAEPYARGRATQTSRFGDAEGHTALALGYPGERLALELTLDARDRVIRETLVGPNHLIHRSFRYPDGLQDDADHEAADHADHEAAVHRGVRQPGVEHDEASRREVAGGGARATAAAGTSACVRAGTRAGARVSPGTGTGTGTGLGAGSGSGADRDGADG